MGICFEVDSLLGGRTLTSSPPLRANRAVRSAFLNNMREVIQAICQHFGWEWVPWEEPSERHGTDGNCFSAGFYYFLRALAMAISADDATSTAEMLMTANAVADKYPHLTNRNDDGYCALYIPVDFDPPFQIKTSFEWGTCTIASSVGLARELKELRPLLVSERSEQHRVVSQRPEEDWNYFFDNFDDLLACADNSLSTNLPMRLQW